MAITFQARNKNIMNFNLLVLTLALLPCNYASPVSIPDYDKFIQELKSNDCSLPSGIHVSTPGENFEYLSMPLKVCQTFNPNLHGSREASLLCGEIFEMLKNITCSPQYKIDHLDIHVQFSTDVCVDFSYLASKVKDTGSLFQRLTDQLVCGMVCTDDFRSACQFLLWSYEVLEHLENIKNSKIQGQKQNEVDLITEMVNISAKQEDANENKNYIGSSVKEDTKTTEQDSNKNSKAQDAMSSLVNKLIASNTPDAQITAQDTSPLENPKTTKPKNTDTDGIPNLKDFNVSVVSPQEAEKPESAVPEKESTHNANPDILPNTLDQKVAPIIEEQAAILKDEPPQLDVVNSNEHMTPGEAGRTQDANSEIPKKDQSNTKQTTLNPNTGPPPETAQPKETAKNTTVVTKTNSSNTGIPKVVTGKDAQLIHGVDAVAEIATNGSVPSVSSTVEAPLEEMENEAIKNPADENGDQYADTENGADEGDYPKEYDQTLLDTKMNKEATADIPKPAFTPKSHITEDLSLYKFLTRNRMRPDAEDVPIPTFPEQEDSHFFFYFLSMVLVFMAGYLIFHNKQKIIALIVEGRHERRRRSHGASYKKLDTK